MKILSSINFIITVFILFLIFIFTFGIGNYGLLSHDEPRYGSCALKMLFDHNFIVPKYDFEESMLADKPPLFCWLIAISYKILGISDFTSRVPSAISAILLIIFTWYIGKTVLGSKASLISAIILATSAEYIFLGRRASTDIVFCLLFSGAMYSMYLSSFYKEPKLKIFWIIWSGIFAGLSLLTKGPVGILLQFLILTVFLITRKQANIKHVKVYLVIGIIALIVSLPWYLAIHLATNGEFTKSFFFTHNLERFTSVVGKHPGAFWFYIPILLFGFLPWTLFLIPALFTFLKHIRNKHFNQFIMFNLIWFLVTFLFFSLSKTKLATYILLVFPPASFITGYWSCIIEKKNSKIIRTTLKSIALTIILATPLSYIFINKSKFNLLDKNTFLLQIFLSIMFFAFAIVLTLIFSKKVHILITSFAISLALPAVFILSSFLTIYYKYTFVHLKEYAILAHKMGAKEIISYGTFHPIIPYYSRTPTNFNESKTEQLNKIYKLSNKEHKVFIIGHLADIKETNPLVVKNKDLFKKLYLIRSDKKYFFGTFN